MLRKVNLSNPALKYVEDQLTEGGDLAKHLKRLNLVSGKLIVYSPDEFDIAKMLDIADSLEWKSGKNFTSQYEVLLIDLISKFLKAGTNNCVIFETLQSVDDPIVKKRDIPYFSFKNQVYYFLIHKNPDEIIRQMSRSSRRYPFIGILTTFPQGGLIPKNTEISEDIFTKIAELTQYIIIGAFDDEGFIIWANEKLEDALLEPVFINRH